jgi:2-C-methyl-D-erythritol 4-phosphate cytidylyltransferase
VIVAAGEGRRLGHGWSEGAREIGGAPILEWALRAFEPLSSRRDRGHRARSAPRPLRADRGRAAQRVVVRRRVTRSDSVRAGFAAAAVSDGDLVAVHGRGASLHPAHRRRTRSSAAAEATGAAIAAIPIVDTIKRCRGGGRIVQTVDREGLYGAATPQAFRGDVLRRALASGRDGTDESVAVRRISAFPSRSSLVSRRVFKITTEATSSSPRRCCSAARGRRMP